MDASSLRSEATDLLRALLRLDTTNPPGNETPAAELLAGYLRQSGVECELVARDPARANLVVPGRGNGPSLMLLGHTDVVPADAGRWRNPPSWLVQERPDLATDYVLNEGTSERLKLADSADSPPIVRAAGCCRRPDPSCSLSSDPSRRTWMVRLLVQ